MFMRRYRLARIAQITGLVALLGASVGAGLGAILVALLPIHGGDFLLERELVLFGAEFGAATGAVLAPIAAWTLMRRVPLWRAIAETAVGTVLGAAIGLIGQPLINTAWLSPVLLGIAGFILAAIRLRLAAPRKTRASGRSAPEQPET